MVELKRGFGFWTIIALLLTSMVGTGMFFGTAIGAERAGNAVLISWILVVAIAVYVAACFGELTAMLPSAGGVYEFSKKAYGRFISFIVGWLAWVMANVGFIILLIAAFDYVLPASFSTPVFLWVSYKILIAIGLIILLNLVAYLGVDTSAALLVMFAIVTIIMFLSIIIPGFLKLNLANFTPFFSKPLFFIFAAMFFMLESLMGWESASFLSEETKNPQKTLPKALIISTLVAGILAVLASFVSLGIIPWQHLIASNAPFSDVAGVLFGPKGAKLMGFGVMLALIGSAAGVVISTPRLLLAMARDKLFISQLAAIHPKRRTPYKAIIFQTIVSIIVILFGFGKYRQN